MATFNFYPIYKVIENVEKNELRSLVSNLGGNFSFKEGEEVYVCVNGEYPEDYAVKSVSVDDKGVLRIIGKGKESGVEEDIQEDIVRGHISYITSEIACKSGQDADPNTAKELLLKLSEYSVKLASEIYQNGQNHC